MLNAIIRFSVRNKLIIGLLTLGWVIWGLLELSKLPIDALPDITSNQVQVITVSPSLASPEVERLITFSIEQGCSNIPGLKEIRSISRFGLSVVTIVFDDKTDIYWARQQVNERLTRVKDEIPRDAGIPELAPVTTGLGEIYQYILRPKKGYDSKFTLTDLRTIQDWIVRRQLLGTPGVADVSSFGGHLKQYEVAIRSERLKSMALSIREIFDALERNNQNSGGAYIEKSGTLLFIRSEGIALSEADIGKIFIKNTPQGIPVYIRDVSEVRIGHAVRYGAMTYMDQGEVAGAVVLMLKGENANRVINRIKTRIKSIEKTLPEGLILESFYDRTKMVNRAISTVKTNLIEGALIVIFVLVFFLGNLRAGLIVASVIPLSMLFAVSMMNLFGVSGNLMSLGALDFGLIVDGAVIIVEAVMHRLYHGKKTNEKILLRQLQMDDAVEQSASRMMNAAVFGQIIILIVYLPILSLTGIEGKMFKPMAQTVAFALVGAFILSLTYIPMLTSLVMSKKLGHKDNISDRIMQAMQRWYQSVLLKVLEFPKTVVSISLVFLAAALFLATRLGGEFIPELEEGDFAIDGRILTGSSLTQSIKVSKDASAILMQYPEVEKIVTRIGASEIPTDPMPIEMTDIIVSLRPKETWTSAKSYDELANKMSQSLRQIPGMTAGFQYPVQMRFNELIAGARQDVVCKIFGENLDSLAIHAAELAKLVGTVNGAKDIYVESITGLPQIVIRYKRDIMALYGLSIADVNRIVRTAFAGDAAGKIYENERRFDLVVRLAEQSRKDLTDVQQLLVPAANGVQLPLYQVADVRIEEGPNQIQREDAKRRIIVGFNTRGRDVQSVVEELQTKVARQMNLPPGYYIHYGGQFENLVEAKQRLMIAVPVALLLIYLMLYFAFRSFRYGLLIYSAIPLSAIGGILLLWLRDMPFSISAGVGFIALFGVAVLNGIVLITEFSRLKKETTFDMKQIIIRGTETRLRPVLMTAAVASLGFLPMALSHGAGAEVQRPLATVVIGGLITATLLTLVVLPVLYLWFERRSEKKRLAALVLIPFIFLAPDTYGQGAYGKEHTLDSIISMARRQNLGLQAGYRTSAYWEALRGKVFELPRTLLGVEYGNINSAKNDNSFYISQGFQMPAVYNRQKSFYQAGQSANESLIRLQEKELFRELRLNYYTMQDLRERKELLLQLDSIYSRFLRAAESRYRTGETNLLEKTTAEAQVAQLKLQQRQLEADMVILQQRQAVLLSSDELFLPVRRSAVLTSFAIPDTSLLISHPQVRYWEEQGKLLVAQTELERSRMSPEFILGYSNLSIIGWQSPDGVSQKYYSGSDRFSIFQFTMGLPIFNQATKSRIRAGNISSEISTIQKEAAYRQIRGDLGRLETEYARQAAALRYYDEEGRRQSEQLMTNARLSFEKGELSYMEWTLLMNQAMQIRLAGLDARLAIDKLYAEYIYLTGNQ
jgi:cobalt-zinc-cadmium resistance protein CzcA